MTNFEKIKAMSVEEMAKYLSGIISTCEKCAFDPSEDTDCNGSESSCEKGHKQWLQSEAEKELKK